MKPTLNSNKSCPVALLTGASSGFGLLTSLALAREGFRVLATMRNLANKERLEKKQKSKMYWIKLRLSN